MSDLASPLLVVMESEVEAFWAFQALMETVERNFHKDQLGMHVQLESLNHMCRLWASCSTWRVFFMLRARRLCGWNTFARP